MADGDMGAILMMLMSVDDEIAAAKAANTLNEAKAHVEKIEEYLSEIRKLAKTSMLSGE